jgi:hypothetical protein
MTLWMTLSPHSCLCMGKTSLCILNSLLFALRLLHHPHSSIVHQHCPLLPSLHLPVLLLSMNHLLLAHSASNALGKSGCPNSGQSLRGIGSLESPLQCLDLLMKITTLMTHWTFSMCTQPPSVSPHHIDNLSFALTETCGTRHARKRWRLTESMAHGRLSNCLLGSMQSTRDGS